MANQHQEHQFQRGIIAVYCYLYRKGSFDVQSIHAEIAALRSRLVRIRIPSMLVEEPDFTESSIMSIWYILQNATEEIF